MAIKALLRHAFEHALNRFLSLDSQREQYLTPLNGKIIAVHLLPFKETLYLCPTTDSIQILDQSPQDPDTTLTGSVFAFGLMGLSQQPMRSIFSVYGEIHLFKFSGCRATPRLLRAILMNSGVNHWFSEVADFAATTSGRISGSLLFS